MKSHGRACTSRKSAPKATPRAWSAERERESGILVAVFVRGRKKPKGSRKMVKLRVMRGRKANFQGRVKRPLRAEL